MMIGRRVRYYAFGVQARHGKYPSSWKDERERLGSDPPAADHHCFLPWTCAVRGEKAWPLARQVAGQSQEETKQFDFSPWIRASFRAAPRLLTATGTGRLHYNNADPYSDRR
jgi:hypothetical protein